MKLLREKSLTSAIKKIILGTSRFETTLFSDFIVSSVIFYDMTVNTFEVLSREVTTLLFQSMICETFNVNKSSFSFSRNPCLTCLTFILIEDSLSVVKTS